MTHKIMQPIPDTKQHELHEFIRMVAQVASEEKATFFDGKDNEGKVVTNTTLGFGSYLHHFSDGRVEPMYRIGISPNATGFSIYVLGLKNNDTPHRS